MTFNDLKHIYKQIREYWNPPNHIPNNIPPIFSHYNISSIVDIHYRFYVVFNLNLGRLYSYWTDMHRFSYIHQLCRFPPYNYPFQSSWGSEIILNTESGKIYNLWCYKISRSYWFQVPDDLSSVQTAFFPDLSSIQTARFPMEPYTFSLYNPHTFSNHQNNIDLLEIKTRLNPYDGKTDMQVISQSAPVKSINSRFKEVTSNKIQNINDPLTLKTTNLKHTLDNCDLSLKIFWDTIELLFIPEFYNWFIFFSQYMLLFTFSLIFLFPSNNFKFINLNFNINYKILWPLKYLKLINKVYKRWVNYIFKWWGYY